MSNHQPETAERTPEKVARELRDDVHWYMQPPGRSRPISTSLMLEAADLIESLAAERTAIGAEKPRLPLATYITDTFTVHGTEADLEALFAALDTKAPAVPAPDKAPEPSGAEEMRPKKGEA
jgi:hypothetical protein